MYNDKNMTYTMNPQQFESVTKLSGQKRYEHFIGKVGDWEEMWSLINEEGFVSINDDHGNICMPFWPHEEYAKAMATKNWGECLAEKIKLADFLEKWLPRLEQEGLSIAVFPTANSKGVILSPSRLKQDLELEIEQYE